MAAAGFAPLSSPTYSSSEIHIRKKALCQGVLMELLYQILQTEKGANIMSYKYFPFLVE